MSLLLLSFYQLINAKVQKNIGHKTEETVLLRQSLLFLLVLGIIIR